jgi:serine/threonine protein kinase
VVGQTLRHYRIESKLGEGGMGVVYKATDTHLDRPVAIKVLRPEVVSNPESKRRFVQEAKAASALNHPNILHIYDIDEVSGVAFIAMEYVNGQTLDRLIPHKGLPHSEALEYALQVANAPSAAHAAGIVHRDLKPANLIVTKNGMAKVLDFGLAKLIEPVIDDTAPTATIKESPRTEEGTNFGDRGVHVA